jgi:hypothetical protein
MRRVPDRCLRDWRQFFPNKDAIAEALAARFVERLRTTQDIFGPEIEHLPLDQLSTTW